jgi:hypothetical protein
VCMFCSTFLDSLAQGVITCQDIIALTDADNTLLTKLLPEMRPGVLPMTPKHSERFLNGSVRYSLSRKKN